MITPCIPVEFSRSAKKVSQRRHHRGEIITKSTVISCHSQKPSKFSFIYRNGKIKDCTHFTCPWPTVLPKYVITAFANSHFERFKVKEASARRLNTKTKQPQRPIAGLPAPWVLSSSGKLIWYLHGSYFLPYPNTMSTPDASYYRTHNQWCCLHWMLRGDSTNPRQ